MESKREQNKRQCREKILKASVKLFGSKGYDKTLIGDVAKKAQVSRATLYNYFPSKESLLLGIAQREIAGIKKEVRERLKTHTAMETIRSVIEDFVFNTFRYVTISRKLFIMNSEPDSFTFSTRVELVELLRELVEAAKDEGAFRADVPTADIAELLHTVLLTTQFCWLDVEQMTREECTERLDLLLERVLAGVVAAP